MERTCLSLIFSTLLLFRLVYLLNQPQIQNQNQKQQSIHSLAVHQTISLRAWAAFLVSFTKLDAQFNINFRMKFMVNFQQELICGAQRINNKHLLLKEQKQQFAVVDADVDTAQPRNQSNVQPNAHPTQRLAQVRLCSTQIILCIKRLLIGCVSNHFQTFL